MRRIDIGFTLKLFYIGKDKNVNYKSKGYYETR